ncbi:MAG: tetratricopeptide repeat protein [Nitrospiraceae bacterium]
MEVAAYNCVKFRLLITAYALFVMYTVAETGVAASPAQAESAVAADAAANEQSGASSETESSSPSPATQVHVVSHPLDELPDGGPRREPWVTTEQLEAMKAAHEAFATEQWDAAWWMFTRVEEQAVGTGLAPMARAYRAEIEYRRKKSPQYRLDTIELYRALIRDFPDSANASRAGWRVGDLFLESGWKVEAQAAYERAAKGATIPEDRTRAFLGMGLMYVEHQRFADAVQTLKAMRQMDSDEVSRAWTALGLAEAYYALGKRADAGEQYKLLADRWPERLRLHAQALMHAGDLEQAAGRVDAARRMRMQFYNLYPNHPRAKALMVAVGDSYRKSGLLTQAETVYGLLVERHPESPEAGLARLRLATLGVELAASGRTEATGLDLLGQVRRAPRAPLSDEAQTAALTELSVSQAGSLVGSEALFTLAEQHLRAKRQPEAEAALEQTCGREGRLVADPWPARAQVKLAELRRTQLLDAARMADDFHTVELFHRLSTCTDWTSGHSDVVIQVAEAHRRVGFLEASIPLYQQVLRDSKAGDARHVAIVGLGRTYLEQRDAMAARRMFERYQLEFPLGALKGEALRYLIESWALLGDSSRVIRFAQRWFKALGAKANQDAGYGQVLLRLAGAQAAAGQHREAIKTVRLAEQAGVLPYVDARMKEGRFLEASGAARAAMSQWADVVRSEPASEEAARARLAMARLWWQQDRLTEVQAVLSRVPADTKPDEVRRAAGVLKNAAAVQVRVTKEQTR